MGSETSSDESLDDFYSVPLVTTASRFSPLDFVSLFNAAVLAVTLYCVLTIDENGRYIYGGEGFLLFVCTILLGNILLSPTASQKEINATGFLMGVGSICFIAGVNSLQATGTTEGVPLALENNWCLIM